MNYLDIRKKYIEYLISKGHQEIPSASLVPENDPSLLFTNAGMSPLVPYLLGEKHPKGNRLVNSQRCVRTGDIECVGDDGHCTSFEMLGNWSLNDYFKEEAINITIGFLVDELGFNIKNIYASVFEGDSDGPRDEESIRVWTNLFKKYGIIAELGDRIQLFSKKKNWWELEAGGPCGPCSEIFYDTGKEKCGKGCNINCDCGKYLELGNNVFMEYLKKDGTYSSLGRHNVDFGGGLERFSMIMQNKSNYYETDIYEPILKKVKEISKLDTLFSQRVIVDHIKAATWIIADGIIPGRTGQGYVLRRLIRRSIRHAKLLGIEGLFTNVIAEVCINQFIPVFKELGEKRDEILRILEDEEKKFNNTIERGLKEFEKNVNNISGEFAFTMYETYGFPLEMYKEELNRRNIQFDEKSVDQKFNESFSKHQDLSRTAAKGMFKGGLADTSDMSKKYHTLNHLLLSSLYKILGNHIYQKGSNITQERLRLDFPNPNRLTAEQIKQIEDLVNEQIQKGLPVSFIEMPKEEALKVVKYASFAEKYPDTVKVYTIGNKDNPFSIEICGGPHVNNTNELGTCKIIKEESVSSGIRRIKAILT